MKLPYGIVNFKSLREEGYLYVDKTAYIEKLERLGGKYLFFIRPRRFGKSLFLSTLEHYYDVYHQDNFERLFGYLDIGCHPTELRNHYMIMKLNFSAMNTDSKEVLMQSFTQAFKDAVSGFFSKYQAYFADVAKLQDQAEARNDLRSLWNLVFEAVRSTDRKIYLIIDEYDHFANDIIAMGDSTFYKDVIRASGFVRDFYEAVKIGAESVIDRIFITGISPIMLDDLTSGFNIAVNITTHIAVNEMLGFTEQEVRNIMEHVHIDWDKVEVLPDLRRNYNGYLFNKDADIRVYNPNMILYFFNQWETTGNYPDQLIDDNVKTDYGRLQRLITNDHNREVLNEIIQNEGVVANLVTRFSFDRMYDEEYFVSLLFYMGLLTIDRQERMKLKLVIPNYVVKTVYWEYIEKRLRDEYKIRLNTEALLDAIGQMAYEGKIQPYIDYIVEHVLKPLSNRDLRSFNEKYVKVILFAYLVESRAYKPFSERETANGYIDIFLEKDKRMPDVKYEWLIELKYLKKSDANLLETTKQEGLQQLASYAASRDLTDRLDVRQALIIFIGKDKAIVLEK